MECLVYGMGKGCMLAHHAGAPRRARQMCSDLSFLFLLPHTVAMFADIDSGEVVVDAEGEGLRLSVLNGAVAAVISQHIPLHLSAAAGSANASAWTGVGLASMQYGPWRGSGVVTQLWMKVWVVGGSLGFMCCTCCNNCAGRLQHRVRRVGAHEGRRGGFSYCGAKLMREYIFLFCVIRLFRHSCYLSGATTELEQSQQTRSRQSPEASRFSNQLLGAMIIQSQVAARCGTHTRAVGYFVLILTGLLPRLTTVSGTGSSDNSCSSAM